MKRTRFLPLVMGVTLMLSSCTGNERFIGMWNKDLNTTYDPKAFPEFTKKGTYIRADPKLVTSPVFIRIKKTGEYYELRSYIYDVSKKELVPDDVMLGNIKFKDFNSARLVSDNEASQMVSASKITIDADTLTGEIKIGFAKDGMEMPPDEKSKALLNSLLNSGFHKVGDVSNRYNDAHKLQEELTEQHVLWER